MLSADLVKNAVLNEIEREKGKTELAYQKYWQPFDYDSGFWRAMTGRGHAQRARIEIFLQHALTILSQEEVAAAHLYTAYRDFARSGEAGSALERMAAFKKYGEIYKRLLSGDEQPRIRLFLERLGIMGFETVYPFLIKLFDILSDDEPQLLEALLDLESFLVRRMVCRLSTRGYNRFFVDLLRTLDQPGRRPADEVRAQLLTGTAEVDRWPADGISGTLDEERLVREPHATPFATPARSLGIRAAERFAETNAVPRNLTVEHIMPQAWEAHWPLPAGTDPQEAAADRVSLLHTIGNLTLLNNKLNPVQSHKAWKGDENSAGKREALQEHSVLYLNKAVAKTEVWNEQSIQERSSVLFEVARQIWPRPTTSSSNEPPA